MVARTFSATLSGVDGVVVHIEVATERAVPKILMTGLAGDVIRESRDRVRVCLSNLGFDVPRSRILVHLSPADSRKQGSHFDLGIAMGILCAERRLRTAVLERTAFLGELGLDGKVRGVQGALALAQALVDASHIETVLVPKENASEVALLESPKLRKVEHLTAVIEFLESAAALESLESDLPTRLDHLGGQETVLETAIDQVVGHPIAKRALEISLAGRHHFLMIGPPGVGKSMLAQCAPSLLPPLGNREVVEVAKNHSSLGTQRKSLLQRPFRAPHHSISAGGLLGGGSGIVVPGEVTLAHRGVLFLDEFPEFRRDAIEGLREPMQSGIIHLNRVGHSLSLPARFLLIAAMNPCPCGFALSNQERCGCAWEKVAAYRKRISGAILDRFDLGAVMTSQPADVKNTPRHQGFTIAIREAHRIQVQRYGDTILNGDVVLDFERECERLNIQAKDWFVDIRRQNRLSFRALQKLLKVGRTIADLATDPEVKVSHLQEAWSLRCPTLHTLAM